LRPGPLAVEGRKMKIPYQDEWRHGKLSRAGRRNCENRYNHISAALKRDFGRRFSVADIGGWDGYFLRRLEEDLEAVGTLVEPRGCDLSGYNIAHKQMNIVQANAQAVGKHDVIMALSVFHHMQDWEHVYVRLGLLCKTMIVESAHPGELDVPKMSRTIKKAENILDKQYEKFTADAFETLCYEAPLDKPSVKRPTLLIKFAVDGRIEEGKGGASARMPRDPEYWEPLGFLPYPGTLNVNVGIKNREWLRSKDGVEINGLKYVPAKVNGMGGFIRFSRDANLVEFLSQYRLRDVLNVETGDTVEVRPR